MDSLQDNIAITDAKEFDSVAADRSIVKTPSVAEGDRPRSSFFIRVASAADAFLPFGSDVAGRDRQLRTFWADEPFLASAVYSVVIRNASFSWEIVNTNPKIAPRKNTILAITKMLNNSERGQGWDTFIKKFCTSLYTQDNGSFTELIRSRPNDPTSPVINIATLDSARCLRTGDPKNPVIYTDKDGKEHLLRWFDVVAVSEFPSVVESMYGVQLCAVSRALRASQTARDISIYMHEKISGRFAGQLQFVSGISRTELEDALINHMDELDNNGMSRFSGPTVIPSIDPTHPVSTATVDFATLPDNFDQEVMNRWYIAQLAMAFGVDYGEFAPLPSGNLGSGQQAEILHLKTRGKGPATIMKLIEHFMNNSGIIPSSVRFQFKVQDLRADSEAAAASFDRSKDRSLRIKSGELDVLAAQQIAFEVGDIPAHIYEEMRTRQEELREAEEASLLEEDSDTPTNEEETRDEMNLGTDQIEGGSDSHDER